MLLEGGRRWPPRFRARASRQAVLVFIAPLLAGSGPTICELAEPMRLSRTDVQRVGDDVLVSAYVHEP